MEKNFRKIAVLTSGGDAPGMNAAVRAVVNCAQSRLSLIHIFKKQLAVHLRKYNNFPMRPLNWISPKATLNNFLKHNVTYH